MQQASWANKTLTSYRNNKPGLDKSFGWQYREHTRQKKVKCLLIQSITFLTHTNISKILSKYKQFYLLYLVTKLTELSVCVYEIWNFTTLTCSSFFNGNICDTILWTCFSLIAPPSLLKSSKLSLTPLQNSQRFIFMSQDRIIYV